MSETEFSVTDADGDRITMTAIATPVRRVTIEIERVNEIPSCAAVALGEKAIREIVAWGQAWLDAPRLAARDSAEVVAGWVSSASAIGPGLDSHVRKIGAFVLNVEDIGDGCSWSVDWGDNQIDEGTEFLIGNEDSADATTRAKAACEAAARKAGIAVPAEAP